MVVSGRELLIQTVEDLADWFWRRREALLRQHGADRLQIQVQLLNRRELVLSFEPPRLPAAGSSQGVRTRRRFPAC